MKTSIFQNPNYQSADQNGNIGSADQKGKMSEIFLPGTIEVSIKTKGDINHCTGVRLRGEIMIKYLAPSESHPKQRC